MSLPKEQPGPILLVDLVKGYGGAEVRVLETARFLNGRYPYAVATLAGSPLHERLKAAGLTALPVPFPRGDVRLLFFLREAIRQGGYKVVDAHNVQSQWWGHLAALLAGGTVRVSTVHSAYRLEHAGSLKGRLYEGVLRFNNWAGARFIAVSPAVDTYLQSTGVPARRISLIPNSITLPEEVKRSRQECALLASLDWPANAYIVIVVARLEPVKGHQYLLEALAQVVAYRPQLRCLVVGEGRTRTALETQLSHAGLQHVVHLAGFRDDIPALLSISDAFCLPSLSEGLPFALLEACAHRLPVLVTAVGGMAELLRHQETAFLVPPANSQALAEGLCWLLDHPGEAAHLSQSAFNLLKQRFGPAETMERVLAVYRQQG